MRITILTYGSRGDVQPFLPLSRRLIEVGNQVKLAAPFRFRDFVEAHGITFVPLAGNPEELSRRLNDAGYNFIKMVRELMNHAIAIGADVWRQSEEACKDADLILHTFTHAVGAHTLARQKNIPDIHMQTFPMFAATGEYPNVTLPDLKSKFLNRLTHQISAKITWWAAQFGFERVRRQAGLPKQKLYWPFDEDLLRPPTPILCAWSPSVLPPSSDWQAHVHVTGYYFFPHVDTYRPQEGLASFLQSGKPPVCITFGSMVNQNAERIHAIVRAALRKTNNRGIVLSGWSGITNELSNDILYLEAVPHDWLLPRCKMVVHHGGAGTTAAGLRAGIPNIVVPFTADQPFWGRRVHTIGAGPRPILVKKLSAEKLGNAIAEAETEPLAKRAQVLGGEIRSEDGTGEAIKWIEKYSNDFHRPH